MDSRADRIVGMKEGKRSLPNFLIPRRGVFMFTGIITHLGRLKAIEKNCFTFSSQKSLINKLKKGESIAVNGACLTVIKKGKSWFSVEVMPETLKRTMLGDLRLSDYVNLELPLSPNAFLSGHLVQGHADGTATIASIVKQKNSRVFRFKVSPSISRYLVNKGSVAVNGISLTIIETGKNFFTVGIIPHTWEKTMFRFGKPGDKVNVEVDIVAKYIEKFLKK